MKNFIHKFNIKYKKILDSSNVLFYSILGLYLTINLMLVFIYPYFPNKVIGMILFLIIDAFLIYSLVLAVIKPTK